MEEEEIKKLQEENAKLVVENQQLKNEKDKALFKADTYKKQVEEYANTLNNLQLKNEPEKNPEEEIDEAIKNIFGR